MRRSVEALEPTPDLVLVDAVRIDTRVRSVPVVRGDALSYAIACASIVAKVHRDRIMAELDEQYPDYGFWQSQGVRCRGSIGVRSRCSGRRRSTD